ncbi:MAG: response regulator, partial [Selenomonadaceae bacterium]|nr:response regulator [Selenomonadaceae bacterium]
MVHVQGNAVLVIDDDEINLSVARLILEKTLKCKVLTADSALEGLRMMRSQHVSVVLLDIEMPDMNGFEALQEIRADERLRNLPVIMLTSAADRETIARVMEQGVRS